MIGPFSVAGLILAGGRGERLGGIIKSEIRVGGVRLLDRVATRLAGCRPILVAHGRHAPESLRLPPDLVPTPDLDSPYAGPLAGLAAAIAHLSADDAPANVIICAAVDAPFLPADYVERLVTGLGAHDAAIASCAGQPYPTNSAWRVAAFRELPAQLLAGTAPRSLKSLAAHADSVEVAWELAQSGDPFANINTPEELAEMERRATVSPTVSRD